MTRVTAVLHELLAVTTTAPADADTTTLIAGIDAGIRLRREVLDAIGGPLPIQTADEAALLVELEARRQSWHDALVRAQLQVGNQIIGLRRARAYTAVSRR